MVAKVEGRIWDAYARSLWFATGCGDGWTRRRPGVGSDPDSGGVTDRAETPSCLSPIRWGTGLRRCAG